MNSIFIKTTSSGTTRRDEERGVYILIFVYVCPMERIIQVHGTSKCIGIPAEILKHFGLKPGDRLDLAEQNGKIIVTPVKGVR